ncbi:MAG: hypothetical protein R3204_03320 [Oceanospirillum sp.]|nr:hypothetical protein [Oceanospirillum sp.]
MFSEVKLAWGGEEYSVTPDMRLLAQIESRDICIARMIADFGNSNPKLSHMAIIYSLMLNRAGCKASEEDVLAEMMSVQAGGLNAERISEITGVLIQALIPAGQVSDGKK